MICRELTLRNNTRPAGDPIRHRIRRYATENEEQ